MVDNSFKMQAGTPAFFRTHPRACALILAATHGSRLFPMTSSEMPKHLLPIAGVPCILRLLESLAFIPQIIVALSADDSATVPLLQSTLPVSVEKSLEQPQQQPQNSMDHKSMTISINGQLKTITVIQLSTHGFGPVDALREIEEKQLIHPSTRLVVFPGDLVFLEKNAMDLDALLRPPSESDCIVLLVDVGEVDENGIPLKESAKAKKGALSRDEEDIEYIALSYPLPSMSFTNSNANSSLPRILWKKSKIDVERNEDMTGSTAKLELPKARLRHGKVVVKTSWADVHVYSLPPWTREMVSSRHGLASIQEDMLQLLISRQFRGKKSTLGKDLQAVTEGGDDDDEEEEEGEGRDKAKKFPMAEWDEEPFHVGAVVVPSTKVLRANTIASFHYACREAVANGESLTMPPRSKWNGKFQTLVGHDTTLGAKINMKSSVIGKGCQLGAKCRLNNVVIMDNVIIGENCSLQNTLIGSGAILGNNCSLNDCQVGPGMELPPGTKEKGESFVFGDSVVEDLL